ncbi:hypothetical protein Plim_3838 [Planctopirus limnophila DSM 3776]|uniref:Lipoprotein n=1 Tax=Planctopirus limnophila (strain ATCC 43296 / DSM 3776 / IFAM 1008 / Mu 290) TaxID=521674 RepID=D5SX28_PLAL2|nr:hypothetical protein [Planctopirus limnophila]ADG69650.1 hypothetical protein Plim_3838 [Planctopirus limnophila DSM 3776]
MLRSFHIYLSRCLVALPLIAAGCISFGHKSTDCGPAGCQTGSCETGACPTGGCNNSPYDPTCGVQPCGGNKWGWKKSCNDCNSCNSCGTKCGSFCSGASSWWGHSANRNTTPEQYALGTVHRAHFHQMETNAEAADFILYYSDFVGESAELTPDGKDKILEIASRMRSAPFPVLVERTMHNADPELDNHRRQLVAQILTDLGNPDAYNRTFVATSYGPGKHSLEAAPEFYQNVYQNFGNDQFGNGGGFGGGGFGGGGFGGGGFGGFGGGFGF